MMTLETFMEKEKGMEYPDSMHLLCNLLRKNRIPFEKKRHLAGTDQVIKLLGMAPAGRWHVIVRGNISVVRGMTSFGLYEAYGGPFKEPERFSTPKELVEAITTRT